MNRTIRAVTLTAVAAAAAGGIVAHNASADRSPDVATIGDAVPVEVGTRLEDWANVERMPVMPDQPLSVLEQDATFTVGRWGGIKSVRATLNGVPLDVRGIDDHFELSIGDVKDDGPATLLLTEQFVDDTTFAIPYTVYITSTKTAIEAAGTALKTVDERTIGWGAADGEAGYEVGKEAETQAPKDIAATASGAIAVLDTVNQRVLNVLPDGKVVVGASLPTAGFSALAPTADGSQLVAIDASAGVAVDVGTGKQAALPPMVRSLPMTTAFELAADGSLLADNPADGATYTIAALADGKYTSSGPIERNLAGPRVTVDGNGLNVQTDLNSAPTLVTIPHVDHVAVFDAIALADGRIVVLAETGVGGRYERVLVVTDGQTATVSPIAFNAALTMTNHLVTDGESVTVAYNTPDGLQLDTYRP